MSLYEQSPTSEDIEFLFSDIIGRPITAEATQFYLQRSITLKALHHAFLNSSEGRWNQLASLSRAGLHENLNGHVEWEATRAELNEILAHIKKVWERFGRDEAHFSVLTHPMMKPDQINEEAIKLFYETGRHEIDTINAFCAAAGVVPDPRWRVAELGCGLGRITQYLSESFQEVVGIDISREHLSQAEHHLREIGRTNASFAVLQDYLSKSDKIDMFVSFLVLQHNPPPVMAYLLKEFFNKIRSGGVAVFQITTTIYDYEFRLRKYLSNIDKTDGIMEMHALPQPAVFKIATECGLTPRIALPDGRCSSGGISYTFVFQR